MIDIASKAAILKNERQKNTGAISGEKNMLISINLIGLNKSFCVCLVSLV